MHEEDGFLDGELPVLLNCRWKTEFFCIILKCNQTVTTFPFQQDVNHGNLPINKYITI